LVFLSQLSFKGAGARRVVHRESESLSADVPAADPTLFKPRRTLKTAATPADHLVKALPGLSSSDFRSNQWAGYVPVTGGKLFYWLFEAATSPEDAPLVIWLNGGPGCSSMDGLFLENGPFKLRDASTLQTNPSSWHRTANMLYVDQPVGTGLSFTSTSDYADNEAEVDARFYEFLQTFFSIHKGFV
ncbi:unnamed protein product, partial [Phaeothamnion confervicola]